MRLGAVFALVQLIKKRLWRCALETSRTFPRRFPMAMPISAVTPTSSRPAKIERDPAQQALAARLDRLNARLETHRLARKSSSLGWFFRTREQTEQPLKLPLHLRGVERGGPT